MESRPGSSGFLQHFFEFCLDSRKNGKTAAKRQETANAMLAASTCQALDEFGTKRDLRRGLALASTSSPASRLARRGETGIFRELPQASSWMPSPRPGMTVRG